MGLCASIQCGSENKQIKFKNQTNPFNLISRKHSSDTTSSESIQQTTIKHSKHSTKKKCKYVIKVSNIYDKIEFLVPGYIHNVMNKVFGYDISISDEIILLLRSYYSFQDKWNDAIANNDKNNVKIYGQNSDTLEVISTNSKYCHMFAMIDAQYPGQYLWKLKMIDLCNDMNIMIGFIPTKYIKNNKWNNNEDLVENDGCMLNIKNGKIGYNNHWKSYIKNIKGNMLKNNDIVTIELNLYTDIGAISYSINDEHYGTATSNLDTNVSYTMAVSLARTGQQIQIVYFETN